MFADQSLPPGSPSGSETILLVEDDIQVRTIARKALIRYGYSVLEAADVDTALALEASHAGPIDLLITDVVLPLRSGGELAAALRARRPDLPAIFMSGYADDQVSLPREAGDTFLQKPFGPESLARKVRETLDRPRRH
jgi:two-component system cell cycle sensor histidine kinase/response regulator CckA